MYGLSVYLLILLSLWPNKKVWLNPNSYSLSAIYSLNSYQDSSFTWLFLSLASVQYFVYFAVFGPYSAKSQKKFSFLKSNKQLSKLLSNVKETALFVTKMSILTKK